MEDKFFHKIPMVQIVKMIWIVSKIKTCWLSNSYSTNICFDFYFRFNRINVLTCKLLRKTFITQNYSSHLTTEFVTIYSCKDSFHYALKMNFIFPADNLIPLFLRLFLDAQIFCWHNKSVILQCNAITIIDNAIIFKRFYLKNLIYVMLEN